MMVGKKDYKRWNYEEETEISVEEQLTLEEHEHRDDLSGLNVNGTFVQPTINLNSRVHPKRSRKLVANSKMQLMGITAGVLTVGFIAGFVIGVKQEKTDASSQDTNSHHSPLSVNVVTNPWPQREISESSFHKLISQIMADNIRHNLQRMSQEVHAAGTPEGRSMATAIRDLWRSYGLSVRVEQHKSFLTKTNNFNFLNILDANGSIILTTSLVGDDITLPNSRPIMAFSPPADLNGTLIYGHYGRVEDFQFLENSQISVNGSIALLRFSNVHLSKVVSTAIAFGIGALVFYPDPSDFGPLLPSIAVKRDSILNLGQLHEFQVTKHKNKLTLPCHTISFNDAEKLLRLMRNEDPGKKTSRRQREGSFRNTKDFSLGNSYRAHLRLFNEVKATSIFNVVAAIPGAWESDRYIVAGCSHDSWTYGAGDPGLGLAIMSEIARAFSSSVQKGWKPRRSIVLISWDANLHASTGVWHWLQKLVQTFEEHHFEISTRAIAYIDLTRVLQGNQTLHVFSSPLLKEVARKAIQRVMHIESMAGRTFNTGITFSSLLTSQESSFAFFGNLGIPFIRLAVSNSPKDFDYPLFHTAFDTFENFANLVDSSFSRSETLGRIISGMIVLLADSSLLPVNVEDYVEEIQKAFGSFMAHYQEDLHKANLSIAYWQAAVMRLEVIGENFRTDIHNRSVINNEQPEPMMPLPSSHSTKTKKLFFHRIINDKMMELDRAFLSRKSDIYKHQIIGFSSCSWIPTRGVDGDGNCPDFSSTSPPDHHFTKLKEILERGRNQNVMEKHCEDNTGLKNCLRNGDANINSCEWRADASQEIASLIRSLDAAAAILQSPLLPEESGASS